MFSQADVSVLSMVEPTNMTFFFNHGVSWTINETIQIRQGCSASSTKLGEYRFDRRTHLHLLTPGLYTVVRCRDNASYILGSWKTDPAATPPNANTSCATAKEITTSGHTQPYRHYDASKIYFKFRTAAPPAAPWSPSIWGLSARPQPRALGGRMAAGSFHVQVQTVCDDPSTAILDRDGTFATPYSGTGFSLNNLVPGAMYWIVFSAIDPGIDLQVDFSSSTATP